MKAGESTTEGARRLYRWLLEELAGRRTNEALEYLRAQLQTGAQATLRVQLCGALETEPSCAQGLAALLGELTAEKLGVTQAKSVSGDGAVAIQAVGKVDAVHAQ